MRWSNLWGMLGASTGAEEDNMGNEEDEENSSRSNSHSNEGEEEDDDEGSEEDEERSNRSNSNSHSNEGEEEDDDEGSEEDEERSNRSDSKSNEGEEEDDDEGSEEDEERSNRSNSNSNEGEEEDEDMGTEEDEERSNCSKTNSNEEKENPSRYLEDAEDSDEDRDSFRQSRMKSSRATRKEDKQRPAFRRLLSQKPPPAERKSLEFVQQSTTKRPMDVREALDLAASHSAMAKELCDHALSLATRALPVHLPESRHDQSASSSSHSSSSLQLPAWRSSESDSAAGGPLQTKRIRMAAEWIAEADSSLHRAAAQWALAQDA